MVFASDVLKNDIADIISHIYKYIIQQKYDEIFWQLCYYLLVSNSAHNCLLLQGE